MTTSDPDPDISRFYGPSVSELQTRAYIDGRNAAHSGLEPVVPGIYTHDKVAYLNWTAGYDDVMLELMDEANYL